VPWWPALAGAEAGDQPGQARPSLATDSDLLLNLRGVGAARGPQALFSHWYIVVITAFVAGLATRCGTWQAPWWPSRGRCDRFVFNLTP